MYGPLAQRWASSYIQNPPGNTDHELFVVINGGSDHGPYQDRLFAPLAPNYLYHSNWAKDLGAFQMAAEVVPCDLLVCMGSHIHFHRPGWLDLIAQAYEENGPSVYGAWAFHMPRPHLRTTCFWLPPELFRAYPYVITDQTRYAFEHGPQSITLWAKSQGFEPMQVTRHGVFQMDAWHHVDVEETLFLDQHLDRAGFR